MKFIYKFSIVAGLLLMAGAHLYAAADTWVGNTSALFSGANWTGGNNPPSSGDSLVFGAAGSAGASLTADQVAAISYAGITFNSGASTFTIGGANGITLTGNILNSSTSLETLNFPIASTAVRTVTMTTGGGNVTLGGNISGTGGGLTLAGTGTLTLSGNNTYTAAITLTGSTILQLQANANNTTAGVSTAMATQNFTVTTLPTGSTIQLRADSTVASGGVVSFDSGATVMGVNSSGNNRLNGTYNFDVNNISTGTGQILYFGPQNTIGAGLGWQPGQASPTPTFNVTGGNSYSLEVNGFYVGNNASCVFNPTTANLIIAQGIQGGSSGGITKNGAGTLTINGVCNYSGGTTIGAGTLTIGGAGQLNSGTYAGNITDSGTLTYNSSAAQTLSGVISSTGALNQNGSGTLTLSGANTYTGTTTINGGILNAGHAEIVGTSGPLGKSAAANPGSIVFGGGTLQYSAANQNDYSGRFVASGSQAISIDVNGQAVSFGTALSSSASLALADTAGGGKLSLTTANTYSGGTTLNGGILNFTTGTLPSSGGITFNGGKLQWGTSTTTDVSSGQNLTFSSGGATLDVNGNAVTLSSAIGNSGTGGLTVKSTAANGVLNLNAANTYTGTTTVNSGATIGGTGSLAGALSLASGAKALLTAGTPLTVSGAVTLSGNTFTTTTAKNSSGSPYTLLTGGSIAGTGVNATPGVGSVAGGYAGVVSISGNSVILTVTSTGTAATWTDGDANQNWSDSLNWSGGVPHLAGDSATFNSVGGGAVTLDANETVAAITLNNPSSDVISGGNTLTLDGIGSGALITASAGTANAINTSVALNDNATILANSGESLTLGGIVANSSGSETLTITGGGTAILSQANTYGPSTLGTVGTTLGGATVQVGNNTALGAGDVTNATSSTLQSGAAGLSIANNIGVAASQTVTVDNNGNNLTLGGIISGSGLVTSTSAGTLTLNGVNTYSGATTISAGTLTIGGAGQLGSGTYAGNITDSGILTYNSSASQTLSGIISGTGALNQNGSGTLTLSGANTFTNTTTISAGTLSLGNSLALQNSTLNYSGGSLTFNGITTATLGALSGTVNLSLLNGSSAAVALTAGGNGSSTTYSGILSGAGSLTLAGTGALSLSGNNSFTGGISIGSTATLQLQANSGNTTAGVSGVMPTQNMLVAQLPSGATIQLRADSSIASSGVVSFDNGATAFGGASGANKLNGTLNFDVNQLTTGSTATTLQFGSTSAIWQVGTVTSTFNVTGGAGYTLQIGPINVGNNISLVFNPTTANMIVGAIANATPPTGTLTKNGAGTLTINGLCNYTGGTTINAGTLALSGSGSVASSPNIVLAAGAMFDVSGLSSTFTLGSSQTLSNSASTATLEGSAGTGSGTVSLTYASGTPSLNVTNGTLTLSSATTFKVNNTGAALAHGIYNIISKSAAGSAGSVAAATLPSVTVGGSGVVSGSPSLQISGGALNLVVDTAPVAGTAITMGATIGTPVTVTIVGGKNPPTDADGDALVISSPVASNGTVTTDGTNITYTATNGSSDTITYTISDGYGGTAGGTINVTITAASSGNNITSSVYDSGANTFTLSFASVPNTTNVVERTTSLIYPIIWTPISTNVAGSNGLWQFIDTTPPSPSAYYRSMRQP